MIEQIPQILFEEGRKGVSVSGQINIVNKISQLVDEVNDLRAKLERLEGAPTIPVVSLRAEKPQAVNVTVEVR